MQSTTVRGRLYKALLAVLSVTLILLPLAIKEDSAWAGQAGEEPAVNISPPHISGTPQAGQTLTCEPGTWSGYGYSSYLIGFTYKWNRNGSAISGQTSTTYLAQSSDVGSQITCTETEPFGINSATSAPVTITAADSGTPPDTGTPSDGSGSGKTELPKASKVIRFPSSKKCVSRRKFKIKVRKFGGITWKKASITVNKKRAKVVKGKRLRAAINLTGLPKGRFTVKITVWADDGQKVEGKRKYRTCTRKKKSKGPKI